MNRSICFVISICILICLVSCGPTPHYEQSIAIDHVGWGYEDAKTITFEISQPQDIYNLHMIIKHGVEYDYENIYLKMTTHFPDGKSPTENLNIDLSGKQGNWLGQCNSKDCLLKVYLLENFKFPEAGQYSIDIEQNTREHRLKEVYGIDIQLFKKIAE